MENKADEARGQLSKVYTTKKRLYILSIFFFIFFVACSLSLPFQFYSYISKLIDINDRHHIFLLCNGILLFLFLNSGSTRTSQTESRHDNAVTRVYINDRPEPVVIQEVERNVISVTNVVQEETKTEQIGHQIQDPETQLVVLVDDHIGNEDEIVATVEDDEFKQKCEAFIEKVRRSMHHEALSNPHF
ncbi:hypothetical protein L6452_00657 [Arctium lappa]|uniref:Uncharacterized protein n=1 Tax=Arctium lappa TaxID=4217 RepID=A0ACB9FEM9_ARCLA|nr:hypothetical protein L6452_00657 [Arctium lappa]